MKRINASKFKEQCLALLEELGPDGLVVTKHNRPIAKVIPINVSSGELVGSMKGKLKILADIQTTGINWHAES